MSERFWSRVEKTDSCWLWLGARYGGNRHGVLSVNGSTIGAHRYSWELERGSIPEKMQVFHTCNNLHCVNPSHLFLGIKNSNQTGLKRKKKRAEDRFFSRVYKFSETKGGCWIWNGGLIKSYGAFWYDGKTIRATHYSWELCHGRKVPEGFSMCHTCDTPMCVNPDHLFLGTNKENTQDKVEKNRQAKGEKHGLSKLTQEQVNEIRLLPTSTTHTDIAKQYGVSRTCISGIRRGLAWL